jgi:hypothetical protein
MAQNPMSVSHPSETYSVYGLTLRSAIQLPCPSVEQTLASPDIELLECGPTEILQACSQERISFREEGFWQCSIFADGSAHVSWKEHFEFVVSASAKQVLWRKLQEVSNEVFFTYFLGQVLSYCLLARGIEPLHATAIVVGDQAVAFLGDSGFGKSTLAATFLQKGYSLLTDDVLALEFRGETVWARPAIARMKLNPDSADAVFCGRRSIPMNSFTSKMIFALNDSQHGNRMVPLQALYVLPHKPSKSRILVRRLSGRSSFLPIVQNTFNDTVLHPDRLKQQFAFAGRLASLIPIKRLSYPRRLDMLPAVADAILADISRESKSR